MEDLGEDAGSRFWPGKALANVAIWELKQYIESPLSCPPSSLLLSLCFCNSDFQIKRKDIKDEGMAYGKAMENIKPLGSMRLGLVEQQVPVGKQ